MPLDQGPARPDHRAGPGNERGLGHAGLRRTRRARRSRAADRPHREPAPEDDGLGRRTTNETLFFRDVHPFEALRVKLLPELLARRTTRELRIWSAACSSGQEPYTIAMLLRESFPQLATWKVEILATDLSPTMVAKARAGVYGKIEINRGLPLPLLTKYFEQEGPDYRISDELRSMVTFREQNLATQWPAMGPFDLVFLRNVLIYFDVETKKSILSRTLRLMRPDGYLLLGAAETTLNLEDRFERLPLDRAGCYRIRS
ncbi:MAG: protein-glutamate O-methyltransferase CheR [Candidatus Binatia bacterium]